MAGFFHTPPGIIKCYETFKKMKKNCIKCKRHLDLWLYRDWVVVTRRIKFFSCFCVCFIMLDTLKKKLSYYYYYYPINFDQLAGFFHNTDVIQALSICLQEDWSLNPVIHRLKTLHKFKLFFRSCTIITMVAYLNWTVCFEIKY